MRPRHLYVHVPVRSRSRRPRAPVWIGALRAELSRVVDAEGWDVPLQVGTVYVGGAPASGLGPGALPELRRRLEPYVAWDDEAVEWTAEAEPEELDEELAAEWSAAGVGRVVLDVGSFHAPSLRWLGDPREVGCAAGAVSAVRRAGIGNIDVQLTFGLPERLERSWRADVERALELEPSHLSLYGLSVEPGTRLERRVREGRERLPDDAVCSSEYLWAAGRLTAEGYRHYEVSHFARPGRESRHNRAHWSGVAYLGIGPGAHSFLPPVRRWNLRRWSAYRSTVEDGRLPVEGSERVEGESARLERIWLALRTARGLEAGRLAPRQEELVRRWREKGWALEADGAVRLTPRGWLRLDRLVIELDAAAEDDGRLDGESEMTPHSLKHVT